MQRSSRLPIWAFDLAKEGFKMNWNTALRSLLLIRFGQELGTDSATARAVADAIDLLAGMMRFFSP